MELVIYRQKSMISRLGARCVDIVFPLQSRTGIHKGYPYKHFRRIFFTIYPYQVYTIGMQERQDVPSRGLGGIWPGVRWSRRQRSLMLFWVVIALALLPGLDRIFANPDQANNEPTGAVVISEFGAAGSGPSDEHG